MGAPKQKWTPEEEAALRAGIVKHGAGKWRTILKDPEFSGVLYLRSNVDLKDKWRNMSVMANGWGSREKARSSLKRRQPVSKQDENSMALSTVVQSDEEIVDVKPLAVCSGSPEISVSKRSIIRLDNLIMEAISNLKEPGGSNKTTIATYIEQPKPTTILVFKEEDARTSLKRGEEGDHQEVERLIGAREIFCQRNEVERVKTIFFGNMLHDMVVYEQYWAPPNFNRLLSSKLKFLTSNGKLMKVMAWRLLEYYVFGIYWRMLLTLPGCKES
ncbi:hypothetical protein C3L33_21014, partial [Rhododendron williamsianum]